MRWSEDQYIEYMASKSLPGSTLTNDPIPDKGPEAKLQVKILKWADSKGFPVFHDRSRGKNKAGWPDVTLCLPGSIVLFAELKSAKGVLRSEQLQLKQQMTYLQHHYYIVKSYKHFQEIIWELTHDIANL